MTRTRMRRGVWLACGLAWGQASQNLTFEVASVKPSPPIMANQRVYFGPPRGGPGTSDPSQITWSYATLKSVLLTAYDVKAYQVTAPAWFDTERYDLVVKVPAGATKEQVGVMWQNLLAERFGLTLHREPKEFQVEELVVAKGGSKLQETTWNPVTPLPEGPPQRDKSGGLASPGEIDTIMPRDNGAMVHVVARAQPISKLTVTLSNQLGRPVLDKTGLTGTFDYTLDYWFPLPVPPLGQPGPDTAPNAGEPGPDLVAAVQQQLGLQLVKSRAKLDVLIVDKAEKVPTSN